MEEAGFHKAETIETHKRLIVSIAALEKCGKTHFALTAPGPIAYFNFDIGVEGVIGKFCKDKSIWVTDYSTDLDKMAISLTPGLPQFDYLAT